MPHTQQLDLPEILSFAIALARDAGKLIKEGSASRSTALDSAVDEKKNSADLVTETDQAVEHFVLAAIGARYPSHSFIGEESAAAGEDRTLGDGPTWIVDPIDGTTNFVHGFPACCVSIGLTLRAVPVLGVVFNPFTNELYSAAQGHGAWLNESIRLPLAKPVPLDSLNQALVGFEWGTDRSASTMGCKMRTFGRLLGRAEGESMIRGARCIGSAALNFCAVAAGQLDMFWEIGAWEWDVCGGTAIALEAGGHLFGSKNLALDAPLDGTVLQGRKYLVIRALPDGFEGQKRLAGDFMAQVEEWDQ